MATTSINCLGAVLNELGWSYGKLIAELRRHAAVDRIVLPKNESMIPLVSRWVNNHQQPDDFHRELLSRATARPRYELFSDEAAVILQVGSEGSGIAQSIAVGSDVDMNRRELLARAAALGAALAADPLLPGSGMTPQAGDVLLQPRSVRAGVAEREVVAAIRQVMLGYGSPLLARINVEPDIRGLDRRVHQAWKLRQSLTTWSLAKSFPNFWPTPKSPAMSWPVTSRLSRSACWLTLQHRLIGTQEAR